LVFKVANLEKPHEIHSGVYLLGSSSITHSADCSVYLVDCGNEELVLIDSGAGPSYNLLVDNAESLGFDLTNQALILTHKHIDHIGAAAKFRKNYGCKVIAHELDAKDIEEGEQFLTGANSYGIHLEPCTVDVKLNQPETRLTFGKLEFNLIHTPGHTPGGISAVVDIKGKRVLFGQDIHGPLIPEWGADLDQYIQSMNKLISLKADILCEGHFGVYQPADRVKKYIEGYLRQYSR
jgi:glyoxylase-like metal-dependent hydrolase (beta-lactamase superfamily II)